MIPGPARLADIAPLAQALWRNAVKTSKGEGGETLRRPDLELTDEGNISQIIHSFLGPTKFHKIPSVHFNLTKCLSMDEMIGKMLQKTNHLVCLVS